MKKLLCLLVIILVFYGCPKKTPTVPEVPDPPTISSFTANPSEIFKGDKSTLSWGVSNATSVSIDQGIGTVGNSSSQEVGPIETTTYTLTASNNDGTVTKSCTITVKLNPPTINSFTATPSEIFLGNKSTLSWDVSNATSVSIDQEIGTVSNSSTQEVSPTTTTTYTLTATNDGGSVTKSCEVTVDTSLPKINEFKATPSSIKSGEKSELYWHVENADKVVIDNGIGVVGENSNLIAGTHKVSPTTSTTYKLTATNNAGSNTRSLVVTVLPASTTVYITNTGEKYHKSGCQYLSQSKIAISLAEACNKGYTPCSVCKPPNCPSISKTNIK